MKISVMGLGWFGLPLSLELKKLGYEVVGSTRTEEKKESIEVSGIHSFVLNYPTTPPRELLQSDCIVLNIPPFKEELEWFKSWKVTAETPIIFVSSISTQNNPTKENALLLLEQEAWIQSHFKHFEILRFGGLIGNGRHPGKYLSGKKNLPDGDQRVRILYLEDAIKFTLNCLEKNFSNQVHTVLSDEHRTKREFYSDYCRQQGLPLPEFD